MKGKFAKLFDLTNGEQVLIFKSYDNDEDVHQISVKVELDVVSVDLAFGYDDEDGRNANFDTFDMDAAVNMYNNVKSQMEWL